MTRPFPDGFRWGTATAAHQIEGGQLEQRLVGAGSTRPARGCVEPSGDCLRQLEPLARRRRPRAPSSASTTTASRSSGAASSPRTGEFSAAALDHYRAPVRGAARAPASSPSSRSTTSRRRGGWPTRAAGRDPATAERFARVLRAGRRRARRRLMRRACTINEPNIVADRSATCAGRLPAGHARRRDRAPPGQRGLRRRPPQGRRRHPRRRAGRAGRHHAVDERLPGRRRRRVASATSIRDRMEDVFLDATAGDDFVGVQTYSRDARRARRRARARGRRARR